MKRTVALVALASLCAVGGTAFAEIGTIDAVPAATLLIPRFEVDLSSAAGQTTLFSVNNASDAPAVAHVTVWSEWTIPVLDFDIYLTGYDVQTVNMGSLLRDGILPRTGPSSALPSDDSDTSNVGGFSLPHDSFGGSCSTTPGIQPNYNPISGTFLAIVQQALSGQPLATNGACSSDIGNETIARGYITIDSVSVCSQEFPSNDGYFVDGGLGTANNNNVLWGDFFMVDPANAFAQGFTAVHVEADSAALAAGAACDVTTYADTTFYCSLIENEYAGPPAAGQDNREGLGSVVATRYVNGGGFSGGTSVIAYRDSNRGTGSQLACGTSPTAMSQAQIVVFDEEENPVVALIGGPSGGPSAAQELPFPYCTNRAIVGTDITTPNAFGWLYLNLNAGFVATEHHQAYVITNFDADGLYSVGFDAIQLNNLTVTSTTTRNPFLSTP